jgi:hypothetical protein
LAGEGAVAHGPVAGQAFPAGEVFAVKNALDTYTQNQLQEIQAKINYNINLMRYDLAKNALLERFEINVEKIVPEY